MAGVVGATGGGGGGGNGSAVVRSSGGRARAQTYAPGPWFIAAHRADRACDVTFA